MPRAGSGGGSHSSGGHHSSSHGSGGHHVSSSHSSSGGHSRAGGGSFHSSSSTPPRGPRPGGGGFGGGPRPTPPHPHINPMTPPPPRGGRSPRYYGGFGGGGCLSSIVALFIVVIIIIAAAGSCATSTNISGYSYEANSEYYSGSNQTTVSSVSREKLTTSDSFDSSCIVDELDWFDDVKSAGKSLKTFYDKTGVQPYIVLLSYNAALSSDDEKDEYAENYYNEHIYNEDTFLFVYFSEKDQDNDVGYMCYVGGNNTRSVMDSEAVEIFWEYIDDYWYSDLSTDDLFETVFTKTANNIMTNSSSVSGEKSSGIGTVVRKILIIAIVIIIALFIAKKINKKHDTTTKDNPNILN